MPTRLLVLIAILASTPSSGKAQLLTKEEYSSGVAACERFLSQRAGEVPYWIQVPVDYENPQRGHFPIYAWSKSPLEAHKKTMIYVVGGPGDSSHNSFLNLPGWNVIFFDQRGSSCSRPPTRELYWDRAFYSSLNTARDIDEIRKALGLEKTSVYGVSYGTIPAHLYGALFKAHTHAVVLEGVIFQSDSKTLIENPRRLKILQKFFNDLPEKMQDRILEISQNPEFSPRWFSNVGRMMLYLDQPLQSFRQFLDNILWNDDLLKTLLPNFELQSSPETEFGFSPVMMKMLSCKELGMNTPGASFSAVFHGRRLIGERNNLLRETNCAPLGFQAHESNQTFLAAQYPLEVPVTYFQGALDGATAASQAVKSFKQAAQSFAQLVLVKEGGHLPLQGPLASGYEKGLSLSLRQTALSFALEGKPIPVETLKELSIITHMEWLLLQRNTKR